LGCTARLNLGKISGRFSILLNEKSIFPCAIQFFFRNICTVSRRKLISYQPIGPRHGGLGFGFNLDFHTKPTDREFKKTKK